MESKKNKFSNLSEALKKKNSTRPEPKNTSSHENDKVKSLNSSKKQRATGKRSNPDYEQVGAYIPKAVYREVRKNLLDDKEMDFSDLVSHLLEEWLSSKHK